MCKPKLMVNSFRDASAGVEKRQKKINGLLKRMRHALAPGSPIFQEVLTAYSDKPNAVNRLRDIVRQVASGVGAHDVAGSAGRIGKRSQLVDLLVRTLESSGYDKSNPYMGGASVMAPSLPMDRAEPGLLVASQLQQLASVQPPFPYETRMPEGALVHQLPKVEYTDRLGIVTPSLVQGRVMCPRYPEVQEVDGIFIVNGIKYVQGFYEGNVIHVTLKNKKFKDPSDKCAYFAILREAFDQYRKEYRAHQNPSDPWWGRRRVMTNWAVYLDEGVDRFDMPPSQEDHRELLQNDMVAEGDGKTTLMDSKSIKIRREEKDGISICVTRFDGRNNIGHVRTEEFVYYPGHHVEAKRNMPKLFDVRNLKNFFYKTDQFQVYYQDWFPHEVRRMIFAPGQNDANARANERTINFLKADQRNAVFIVDASVEDLRQKEINRTISAINEFCRAGQPGYERLAVVIIEDKYDISIESEMAVGRKGFVESNVYKFMKDARGREGGTGRAEVQVLDVNSTELYATSNNGTNKIIPDDYLLNLPDHAYKINTPKMRLVRFSPQTSFYYLVQKRSFNPQQIINDTDRQNMFIEQVAANKPIYIDEQVLAGFTNPDVGIYSVTAANPDSDLFVQKVNKFSLTTNSVTDRLFILPTKLPNEYFTYLKNAASDPIVIIGKQGASTSGSCVHDNVLDFSKRNGVPCDMVSADKFVDGTQIGNDEYVFIRTQMHQSTNTVIMYQYKFDATNPNDLKVIQKLYNQTDMERSPYGWTFTPAMQEML